MENIFRMILDETTLWVPRVLGVILIIIVFYLLAKISKNIIRKACGRLQLDNSLCSLFAKSSGVTLLIFGLITALGTLGINVSAIVAGLGLTGFALGFALKDIVSNLLSGVLILLYRPFKVGDVIKIAAFEGEVRSIDLRYTQLNSAGNKVLMPNSKLFTDPITVIVKNDGNDVKSFRVAASKYRRNK